MIENIPKSFIRAATALGDDALVAMMAIYEAQSGHRIGINWYRQLVYSNMDLRGLHTSQAQARAVRKLAKAGLIDLVPVLGAPPICLLKEPAEVPPHVAA